ncbi:hypothetical protein KCV07_g14, partial [Aureobasidium melanogenum]
MSSNGFISAPFDSRFSLLSVKAALSRLSATSSPSKRRTYEDESLQNRQEPETLGLKVVRLDPQVVTWLWHLLAENCYNLRTTTRVYPKALDGLISHEIYSHRIRDMDVIPPLETNH